MDSGCPAIMVGISQGNLLAITRSMAGMTSVSIMRLLTPISHSVFLLKCFSMKAIRSIFIWIYIGIMTLVVLPPVLICSTLLLPFNPNRTWAHRIGNFWGWSIIKINKGWKVIIKGKEHLPKGSSVIISNHESMSDILALYLLNIDFKWLAKKELFNIPFFGWSMTLCGYIPLVRGSIKSAKEGFEKAGNYLKKGVPILFFPEGTRSHDGELGLFKAGAFKLAIQEQVPITPIALIGPRDIIEKGSWKINETINVKIQILPPIETKGLTEADEENVRHATRDQIAKTLRELRAES
jgi:1-acyl-sn-glycerol-3-phosphate acyltransferase